ncbi:sushi, von Willebrand factor type A, EGF and pentraxin domain-containing protein 1-like [Ciona intestinalis]
MFGSELAVCQANGEWSTNEPTCSDTCFVFTIAILCSRPDQVVNGGYTLTTSTTIRVGTRVVYHCDNGYSAVGERVTQCNSDGEWSSIPPTCQDINECQDDIDNCDEFAECTNTEGSFTCECNVGFTGSGESCTVIECPHPRRPFNGFIFPVVAPQDKWVSNDYVIYSCRDGFSLSGPENATCQPDGAWTNGNRPPTCSDINECEEQPCDPNASCRNRIGSYTCTCNEGYSGTGSTCTEILCPALNNPASGSVTITSRNVQGVANYECNTGYRLDGPQVITCFSNGRWSSTPPACVDENECITGAQCDIHATCSNTIGSYTCQCHQDYTGTGEVCTSMFKLYI